MATERDRKKEHKEAYDQANAGFGSWQMQCKNDLKVYLGDPWTDKDRAKFRREKREAMSFPLIRRIIEWISGYQRENILSIRYDPVEDADEITAEQLTAINTWVMQRNNGYFTISDAFDGCLKAGMNLINVYNDRNLDTNLDRFGYNQFLLDPTFSRRDLRDCHYGMMRKYITRQEAKMLLPGKESFIDRIRHEGADEMYPFFARPQLYGDKLLAYDEFQQRTTQEKKVVIIKPLNKEIVWNGTKAELDRQLSNLVQMGIPAEMLSVISRWQDTVEVTAFLEGQEVSNGIDIFGIGDFSFTPIMAYFEPDFDRMERKLQSVVRGLVDSQRANDKRIMSMIAVFEQQIGAGLDYEEDALVDDEDAFLTGSGKPRLFRKGALSENRARDRAIPDIPGGMVEMQKLFNSLMLVMTGINEEMTGFAKEGNPQISGVLAKLRMQGGLTGIRGLFHNLALSKKVIAGKLLKLYQQYPLDKIMRILNERPSQQFFDKEFGIYDAVAVEGIITDTQRNILYADLVQLKELGLKLGDPAPITWPMLLKAAPIAMKAEVLKEVQKIEQQKQAEQQRLKQIQDTQHRLEIERVKGEIVANRGIAESQRAKAVEDMSDAAYNRAKTAAEIEDLATGRAIELLQAAIQLEQINQQNREAAAKS